MDFSQSIASLDEMKDVMGEELVNFFRAIWTAEETIEPVAWTPSDKQDLQHAQEEGIPAFSVEAPPLSAEYFLSSFNTILDAMTANNEMFKAVIEQGKKDNELTLNEDLLAHAFTEQEALIASLASQLGVENPESEAYRFLELAVFSALQPTAVEAAAKIGVPDQTGFTLGICPVCGNQAALGIMSDEGALKGETRKLWCSFCETRWSYPRIKCVRCGTTKQEDLNFFIDEGDLAHRIYGCATCGGTAKVVDEKSLKKICDPRVEELKMLPLENAVISQSDQLLGE